VSSEEDSTCQIEERNHKFQHIRIHDAVETFKIPKKKGQKMCRLQSSEDEDS